MVMEVLQLRFEPPLIPTCVAGRAKKYRALVVIDAVNFEAATIEIDANFRANQAGRACNKCFFHGIVSASWITFIIACRQNACYHWLAVAALGWASLKS